MSDDLQANGPKPGILILLGRFERLILKMLIIMMMVAVFIATLELAWILLCELIRPPRALLSITSMLEVFGFFFMILIGLELLETIKMYLTDEHIHVEVVFLVAMIAVARKVIILDFKTLPSYMLFGLASVILGLSVGYYLIRASHQEEPNTARGRD